MDVMLLAAQDPTLPDSKKMTVDEVLAQSVIFLIAGYETSSTTLGFVIAWPPMLTYRKNYRRRLTVFGMMKARCLLMRQ